MPATPDTISTALGFDYGARRIGVAVGNALTGTASALGIVVNAEQGLDWARVDALVREWRPQVLLVGLPLTMDGAEQKNSAAARAFATQIGERFRLPVRLVDERLTSHEAAQRFAQRRASGSVRRKHATAIDAVAAEVIVEQWLRDN